MNQNKDRADLIQDDRLAEFVDQVTEGKMNQTESNVDDELLGLEKTILRLNQSLPPVSLDEATLKQMQVRLNVRIRREAQDAGQPSWKRWFSALARPQIGIAFATAALVILLIVFAPLFTASGSSTATAFAPMNGLVVTGILVGGILVIYWIMRRK
jgi:hypothetical protein